MSQHRPRVAIACQGGGSHTAFSAGALKTLLASPDHEFVAFSGTSGGAIDALVAWYGLLRDDGKTVGQRLEDFWDDMSARTWPDSLFNAWAVMTHRMLSSVVAPEVSPYLYPEVASQRLRGVLERHVDFDAIPALAARSVEEKPLPMLLVGAVDVRSGTFKVFRNSWARPEGKGEPRLTLEVTADAILASAAVPTLFRAVAVEQDGVEHLYWDGLFSQNPPVRDLPDAAPEQIWVLQINPTARAAEPRQMGDIRDRRNELAGNLSLRQELHFIEKINKMVRGRNKDGQAVPANGDALSLTEISAHGDLETRSYKEIGLYCIEIPEEAVGLHLDMESKLDRDPRFIRRLFEAGEGEAGSFLEWLGGHGPITRDYRWKDDS